MSGGSRHRSPCHRQLFGQASLSGELVRTSSAYALEATSIIRIDKRAMQDLLHEPGFAEQFLAYLLSRKNRMQAHLSIISSIPVRSASLDY